MLVAISSPYARKGSVCEPYRENCGKDTSTLIWKARSIEMNPTLRKSVVDRAYNEDPSRALPEWEAEASRSPPHRSMTRPNYPTLGRAKVSGDRRDVQRFFRAVGEKPLWAIRLADLYTYDEQLEREGSNPAPG